MLRGTGAVGPSICMLCSAPSLASSRRARRERPSRSMAVETRRIIMYIWEWREHWMSVSV